MYYSCYDSCRYPNQYPYMPYGLIRETPAAYPQEPYTPEAGEICVPVPTEEFGFTMRLCAKVKRDNGVYASIYAVIDETIKVTFGTVSYSQSILDVNIGVVFSMFGKSGFGGTLEVKANTSTGVISACANLDYGVGSVAPWYAVLASLGTVTPAPI